jgi:hypothetical protein
VSSRSAWTIYSETLTKEREKRNETKEGRKEGINKLRIGHYKLSKLKYKESSKHENKIKLSHQRTVKKFQKICHIYL